ncbi:MAG: RICIN domain-containing protein [Deinococcales bacterium]
MDFLDYATARYELEENIKFADQVGFNDNPTTLVTGKHSGLGYFRVADGQARGLSCQYDQVPSDEYCQFGLRQSNPQMLKAAVDLGLKYLAANRGWISHTAECDSCGIVHPLEPRIMLIPRWPTNIFYNTGTPDENVSEFNYLYGPNGIIRDGNGNPFFSQNQSYQQMLNFEAQTALYHVLTGSPYPHFFHQENLREYAAGKSLIHDWTEALLERYNSYYTLPLITLPWVDMAKQVEDYTSFYYSGVTGRWDRAVGTVSLLSNKAAMIYVSGAQISGGQSWNYGDNKGSKRAFSAGQRISASVLNLGGNAAPALNTVASQSSREGDSISLALTASDSDGDILTFQAAGLPTGLAINPVNGLISGVLPANSRGTYNVIVSVTDAKASTSKSFSWTVTPPLVAQKVDVVDADFNRSTEGFSYLDDAFRSTRNPYYAYGQWYSSYGYTGGALYVLLGGRDNYIIQGISGGWQKSFSLSQDAPVSVTFRYRLTQSPHYESDEYSQALVSIDGQLKGLNNRDYVVQLVGDGNGGYYRTTGWQQATVDLGTLRAGTHNLRLGSFNSRKSFYDEETYMLLDDVLVTATYMVEAGSSPTLTGIHQLVNANSNKCLDVFEARTTQGTNIIQYSCHTGNNQKWKIEAVGSSYRLTAMHSNQVLDVSSSSTSDGADAIQWPWNNTRNQLWDIRQVGDYYELRAAHSGKCLSVAGSSRLDEAKVVQWTCSDLTSQRWIIR